MSIEIYFDESNKLDKFTSMFSYYGVIALNHQSSRMLEAYKSKSGLRGELHFIDFDLSLLDYYLNIFKYSLDFIETNIYIVNNDYALNLGDRLNLSPLKIRNLLYMKIPERLVYGVLRTITDIQDVDIYIDEWDGYGNKNSEFFSEYNYTKFDSIISNSKINDNDKIKKCKSMIDNIYGHVQLPKTLKEQLNAQAIYRGLNYKVNKCTQVNSTDYIGLQIIDIILGIFSFLFEEKYLEMPRRIDENIINNLLNSPDIIDSEKELLESAYQKNDDKYDLILPIEDIKSRGKLKDLNKKLKIYDNNNIMKAELVYSILSDNKTLKKLLNLNIFIWPEDDSKDTNSTIGKTYISKYVSVFLNFKREFDNDNIKSIISFHNDSLTKIKYRFSDYRKVLNYPSRLGNLVKRYLTTLDISWMDMD
ncbi:DUF3800 domain-containing protein [Clostridium cylindrosporum]|uniref:DUF3800 domain-containing protein n=1 Tax=Clostridium cylindrosporum DSM 605 TaxID=1121307 RepID=A0A0J8D8F1_CLOCY|nr:DUF3800 domain-containing protein [Clostridium cylindrosporum]KMT22335.1 hypothetical protein CLCY_16c00140 [Clostridium cylindrosporum DSM 605]